MGMNVILATAGYDRTVRLWDCNTQSTYRTLQFTESQVNDLCFSPGNKNLIVAGYPRAAVYDVSSSNPNPLFVFDGHRGNVTTVGYEPQGQWQFSSSDDGTVKTWDSRSPEAHRTFNHGSPVNCAVIHPNGEFIYAADQKGRILVWDVGTGRLAKELQPQSTESIETIAITADGGTLVVANQVGACFLWSLDESPLAFQPLCRQQVNDRHVLKAAMSKSHPPLLATALHNGSVKIWLADRIKMETEGSMPSVKTLQLHERWVWDVAFTSDSMYIFTASSDKTALQVDLKTGEVVKTFTGHQKAITCLSIAEVLS